MIQVIGIVAASLTMISLLPQVIKLYKTKMSRDISLLWISTLLTGMILWFIYGIAIVDIPLILANSLGAVFSFMIFLGKIMYKKYE